MPGMRWPNRSRAWRILRADARVLDPNVECDRNATFGSMPKLPHFLRRHRRDLGERLRVRVFVDEGVGDEKRVLVEHQRIQRGEVMRVATQADDVAHMIEMMLVAADEPAQHAVGVPEVH